MKHEFEGGWTGNVELNYTEYKYDGVSGYLGGDIDKETGAGGVYWPVRWKNDSDKQNALNANLTGNFDLFERQHDLVVGVSLSHKRIAGPGYGGFMGPWTGFDGTIDNIYTWDGSGLDYPDFVASQYTKATENNYSAYANGRFNITDSLNLFAGGRITNWDRTTKTTVTSTGVLTETKQKENAVIVPYAALVYDVNDIFSVYGSYTKIFNPVSSSYFDVDGNSLDPDEGSSYEIGTKASFLDDRLGARFSLFWTEQDSLASYDSATGAYKTLKGTTSKGVELEVSGEITSGWNVIGGYTYTVNEDKDGKRVLTHIPEHMIKLWTTYRLPGTWESLTVGGGMNWQSENGYDLTDSVYPVQGSYAVFNLMARYDFNENVTGTINFNNIFDKKYYAGISDWGIYGAPRNVMVSLKTKF